MRSVVTTSGTDGLLTYPKQTLRFPRFELLSSSEVLVDVVPLTTAQQQRVDVLERIIQSIGALSLSFLDFGIVRSA